MGVLVNGWLVKVALICCYLFMSNILVYLAMGAKTLPPLEWEVEHRHWSPDGREGVVMTINGQFPGPTIRARAGDTVHVKLTNKLHTEGVVIHWHGIRQIGTPWADGTAFISQCPINPGETYDYVFKVDRAGTYFYHGHYGMQRSAGLYGLLIVDVAEGEEEKYKYEGEFHLLLGDWWHSTSFQQEVDLSSQPVKWIGEPQSLLINGRGQFNCSLASSTDPCHLTGNEQYAPDILKVQSNKTYRLRVASSTALSALNLAIEKHTMTVVEADGNYVAPFSVDNMDIYSGESYSVLFTTDQDPSNNYWISVSVRGREPKTPQGLTILDYNKTSISQPPVAPPAASGGPTSISQPPVALPSAAEGPTSTSQPPVAPPAASEGPASQPPSEWPKSQPPVAPRWNDYDYSKALSKKILASIESPNYHKPPRNHDWRIMMLNTQNSIDGYTKWAINNVSLVLPSTPYLGAIRYGLTSAFDQTSPPDKFPDDYDVMKPPPNRNAMYGSGVYMLGFNTTIDVILQNANALTADVSEIHPWHLHGHDFWVLGYGEGKFSEKDEENFNLENPPLRNTAVVFPYGWTAIRFVADNPGVWAFHCHIEPHLHMGMGVVFAEGVDHIKNMEIPKENFACGLTAKVLMNKN